MIHYRAVITQVKSPTIVFIHGLGGDAVSFEEEQKKLSKLGISSLAIDLRGHGLSGDPVGADSYTINRLSKDVVEIIDELSLKSVIICGHCFGGMVSMYLAATYPSILSGLMLVETSFRATCFGLNESFSKRLAKTFAALAYAFPKGMAQEHAYEDQYRQSNDINLSRFISDAKTTSLRSYLFCCSQVFSFNAKKILKNIVVPTVVVAGENDSFFPPEMVKKTSDWILDASLLVVPGVNHIMVTNNPEVLTEIITKFVSGLNL